MFDSGNLSVPLTILVLVTCVYTEGVSDGTNILKSFDEVQVEHYGDDPCAPFSPKMPDFRAPGRRISEVKCFEYVWRSKLGRQELDRGIHCDFVKYRVHHIIGGKEAKLGEYAHMGALGWKAVTGTWIFKCGASLISDKFALTAAHCSSVSIHDSTVADTKPEIVRLGARTIRNRDRNNFPATDANIKQIIVHPRYRSPRLYYDIAIIELEEEVEFKWLVHPSCLHTNFNVPDRGTIAGWGVINLGTLETSPTLRVAEVSIIESSNCDKFLRLRQNRHWNGVVRHQVCAGNLSGGIDTCQGDSGGPLQHLIGEKSSLLHPHRWTVHQIVGITSFGYGCARANTPGVYTRVASFVGWIESVVWPENNVSSGITFPDSLNK